MRMEVSKEVQIYGKTYKGKELYDVLEAYVRRAFFAVDNEEQRKGRDILWFIWASPNLPVVWQRQDDNI